MHWKVRIIFLILFAATVCLGQGAVKSNEKTRIKRIGMDLQSKSSEFFPVSKSGKSGYIDKTGKVVIPLKFERTGYFSEGLGIIFQNEKCGYTDENGQIVVEPTFDDCRAFAEGLAMVRIERNKGNEWGYIGRNGKFIVQPIYAEADSFSEGLAIVAKRIDKDKKGKSSYIDKKGRLVISNEEYQYGFINKDGKIVIPMIFSSAQSFSDGLAPVSLRDGWGYINKKGEMVIKPKYMFAGRFFNGLAVAAISSSDGGRYGFINKKGQVIIPLKFNEAGDFSDGFAPVKIDRKWGYIDKSGKVVIEPQYDYAWNYSEGVFLVLNCKSDCKFEYLDINGKVIVSFLYKTTGASNFRNGLASIVTDDNGLCYMNKEGVLIWKSK